VITLQHRGDGSFAIEALGRTRAGRTTSSAVAPGGAESGRE
jgi:hypothetical protein